MTTTQRNIAITIVRNRDGITPISYFAISTNMFYAFLITITTAIVTSLFRFSDSCATFETNNLYIWLWLYTSTCIFESAYMLFVYLKPVEYSKFKNAIGYFLWILFIGKFATSIFVLHNSKYISDECTNEPIYKLGIAYLWIYLTINILFQVFIAFIIGLLVFIVLICRPRALVEVAEHINRQTGASDEILQGLNHQVYSPYITRLDDTTCTICTEDYVNGSNIVILSCGDGKHHYHKDCIERWLRINSTCPQCRAPVENRPLVAEGRAPV